MSQTGKCSLKQKEFYISYVYETMLYCHEVLLVRAQPLSDQVKKY